MLFVDFVVAVMVEVKDWCGKEVGEPGYCCKVRAKGKKIWEKVFFKFAGEERF